MNMAMHEFNYEKDKVINIVKKILEDAILTMATDIHFDPNNDELTIRLRIDGDLILYTEVPESVMKNVIARVKILAGMNIIESNISQTGFISYKIKDEDYSMHVSSIPVVHGEKIVIHISNVANKHAKLNQLAFNENDYKKIKNLLNNKIGTILISGSTISGKSTTLYAMIRELDAHKNNIFTIENRIKANIEGVNQIQIDNHKDLTPNKLLNKVLESDPNVIVLSEISDTEMANNVLKASSTGRLVISTINSKNIYTTIDNLLNMNVEKYLLSSLTGIISQRLVKRLCPKCRKKRKTTDLEKEIFTNTLNKNVKEIYEPVGCDNCINGYQGQLPISEVLELNDNIRNAITNPKEKTNLRKLIYENNETLFEDGLLKVINGDTSLNEIIASINLNSDFDKDDDLIKKLILDFINEDDTDDSDDNSSNIKNLIPDKIDVDDIVFDEIEGSDDITNDNDKVPVDETTKIETNTTNEEENDEKDIKDENDSIKDINDAKNDSKENSLDQNDDNEDTEKNEEQIENNTPNKELVTQDKKDIEETPKEDINIKNKKKDNNKNKQNKFNIDEFEEEKEDNHHNKANEDDENDENTNNILDKYIISENNILIAKDILEKQKNKDKNINNEKNEEKIKEKSKKQEEPNKQNEDDDNVFSFDEDGNFIIKKDNNEDKKEIDDSKQNNNSKDIKEKKDSNKTKDESNNELYNKFSFDKDDNLNIKNEFENDDSEKENLKEDDDNKDDVKENKENLKQKDNNKDDTKENEDNENKNENKNDITENEENQNQEDDNTSKEEQIETKENNSNIEITKQNEGNNIIEEKNKVKESNNDLKESSNKSTIDKKNSLENVGLSITDEDIKRIKETIDYDDFSYDDSYKNDF